MQRIALLGLMGSGKTTVGEPLAALLGWHFRDNDHELQARFGATAAQLTKRNGGEALHAAEAAVLLDLLAQEEPSVITAAASTVESVACRRALTERAFVVWLRADLELLIAKASKDSHRPWDDDIDAQLRAQAELRHPLFAEVADLTVDATHHEDGARIAAQIVAHIDTLAQGATPLEHAVSRRAAARAAAATDR